MWDSGGLEGLADLSDDDNNGEAPNKTQRQARLDAARLKSLASYTAKVDDLAVCSPSKRRHAQR